jgi:hypothetical protein
VHTKHVKIIDMEALRVLIGQPACQS